MGKLIPFLFIALDGKSAVAHLWQNLLHAGQENLFSGLTALTAEFTVGEGKLMTHDEPCSMAPDDKHDLISGTCSHLP